MAGERFGGGVGARVEVVGEWCSGLCVFGSDQGERRESPGIAYGMMRLAWLIGCPADEKPG